MARPWGYLLDMVEPMDSNRFVLYTGRAYSLEQVGEFADWLADLKDIAGRARIIRRIVRLADGQFGDAKSVGGGVHELRLFFGPGYRVYFMQRDHSVILLLAGGDKNSQPGDIGRAKELARSVRDGSED